MQPLIFLFDKHISIYHNEFEVKFYEFKVNFPSEFIRVISKMTSHKIAINPI